MKLIILAAISLIAIGCSKEDKPAVSTTKLTLAQIEATNEELSAKKNVAFDEAIQTASTKLGAPEKQTAEKATWWGSDAKRCGNFQLLKNSDGTAAYSFSASTLGKDGCGPKPQK